MAYQGPQESSRWLYVVRRAGAEFPFARLIITSVVYRAEFLHFRVARAFRRLARNGLSSGRRIGAHSMPSRPYKDLVIYGCFVLNRLVADMRIDLYQDGLEAKLDLVLPTQEGLSKEEVKREIRSNHFMTDRVIEGLQKEGHVTVEVVDGRYRIRITRDGVLHIRRYNEFYRKIYDEQIRDHYRFTKAPFWLRD